MKSEIRSIAAEYRDDPEGSKIFGTAVVYNSLSRDMGGFKEIMQPGCFGESLTSDIRCLYEHDKKNLLGRTDNGTLAITDDANGLHIELLPPDTTLGRDVRELLKRGDLKGMSFGMFVRDYTWDQQEDQVVRVITSAEIFEVSIVSVPCYEATEVDLRSYEEYLNSIKPELKTSKNKSYYRKMILAS